jgi:hypothetical protein
MNARRLSPDEVFDLNSDVVSSAMTVSAAGKEAAQLPDAPSS